LKKKIAILGASYLQLPLVEKAKLMGVETHCFAWDNEEAVCKYVADFFYDISVLEKELILEKCRQIQIDGITTIATDICIPVVAYVAEQLNLIGNSVDSALRSTNKAQMRASFLEHGVQSPRFAAMSAFEPEKVQGFQFPLIVKPTDRSGSRGVTKVANLSELEDAINRAISESLEKNVVVEEFITGTEVSVEYISWEGQHYFLAITDKETTGEPYFVETAHHQPSFHSEAIQQKIKTETVKALNALGIEYGASHTEIKITEEGNVYLIEVGARMGGDFIGSHLVELSTGFDFVKAVLEVALNNFTEPVATYAKYSGVYYLCKNTERLLPIFSTTQSFEKEKKILKEELYFIKSSNDRSGYLIYQDDNGKVIL
jgi:biotin carboxylase